MSHFAKSLAAVILLGVGGTAAAVTTTTTATLSGPFGPIGDPSYYGSTAVAYPFSAGDSVDLTLTFPGGTPLTLPFVPTRLTITLFTGFGISAVTYTATGSFDFIGAVGPVHGGAGPVTETTDGFPTLDFNHIRTSPGGTLSFTGIHTMIHLDTAVADYPPGTLAAPEVFRYAEITLLSAIPEPSTWALFVAGFGIVGLTSRRRATAMAGIR